MGESPVEAEAGVGLRLIKVPGWAAKTPSECSRDVVRIAECGGRCM